MEPLFFLLFVLQTLILSSATDTITATTPLSGNQKLISRGGKFALGFYSPQNNNINTKNYYIAIWYNNIPTVTPVWMANHDTPVSNPAAASLYISNGNLVLHDQSKNLVWSTNIAIVSNSTIAVISDNGSLVLRDAKNSSWVHWQSMDHPTNTWLPGGKVGLNKITGVNQRLVAWKNSANPASGIFSIELDPISTNQYFIQWNKTRTYWTTGPWNGNIFRNVPEMTARELVQANFKFVNDSRESYFTYYLKKNTTIAHLIIDVTGQTKAQLWVEEAQEWIMFWSQPKMLCEVYAICGPFGTCNENAMLVCNCIKGFSEKIQVDWNLGDYSAGCTRNTPLQCNSNTSTGKATTDKFFTMKRVRLPDNLQVILSAASVQDCELACLNSCSCTAYAYNGSSCFVWHGDLVNMQEQYSGVGEGTLFLRLAASELSDSKSNKKVNIRVVVGGVTVAVICVVMVVLLAWRHRKEWTRRISKTISGTLIVFHYSDLQHVTKNFSEKLGAGGFGMVFKGRLPNSTVVAVKRLNGLLQGEKQFRAEVSTIGKIQHVNLVRLLGFCSEGTKRLLVYEFMPKSSLDVQLFLGETTGLSWNKRYQIALGTARGLAYLHEKCRDCIIHCDIKPENILLDESFVPKIADFGLAKLLGRDFSRVLTTMRGTIGYLAPEWIAGVPITVKADVFSYGMMLFELISGRRNAEHGEEDQPSFFPTIAANKLLEGDVQSLLDPRLSGDANAGELERLCKVACWCIQDNESARPTMGQIIQILEGFLDVNMPPIPRLLRLLEESPKYINFVSNISSNQTS